MSWIEKVTSAGLRVINSNQPRAPELRGGLATSEGPTRPTSVTKVGATSDAPVVGEHPAKRLVLAGGLLFLIVLSAIAAWHYSDRLSAPISRVAEYFWGPTLPPGFASGNGRIEATQYDIAAKHAGRIAEVLVREGDMVREDQLLARIDTKDYEADLRRADAELAQAREDLRRAIATITQRENAPGRSAGAMNYFNLRVA